MKLRLALILAVLAGAAFGQYLDAALRGHAGGHAVSSTSYCLRGQMADGTYTRNHSVAENHLPLGSVIRTKRPVFGHHYWQVRDRIGYGSSLDFWSPTCGQALRFGRRQIAYTVVRYGKRRIR